MPRKMLCINKYLYVATTVLSPVIRSAFSARMYQEPDWLVSVSLSRVVHLIVKPAFLGQNASYSADPFTNLNSNKNLSALARPFSLVSKEVKNLDWRTSLLQIPLLPMYYVLSPLLNHPKTKRRYKVTGYPRRLTTGLRIRPFSIQLMNWPDLVCDTS